MRATKEMPSSELELRIIFSVSQCFSVCPKLSHVNVLNFILNTDFSNSLIWKNDKHNFFIWQLMHCAYICIASMCITEITQSCNDANLS